VAALVIAMLVIIIVCLLIATGAVPSLRTVLAESPLSNRRRFIAPAAASSL
jgi:hypothetical protein